MSFTVARRLMARRLMVSTRPFSSSSRRLGAEEIKRESKKNPEMMVLAGIMSLAFIGAGWYFGQSPTTTGDEEPQPWDQKVLEQYKAPGETPSALNSVVVPSMTLPREVHEKYNKWGKDGYP